MAGTEPLYAVNSYGGGCAITDIGTNMLSTDLSFVLANDPSATWIETHGPNAGSALGTSGPFVVVVDKGEVTEEKIKCSSYSGTTVTVMQTGSGPTLWTGRGYDGTTAVAHTAPTNPTGLVRVIYPAQDAWEANLAVHRILGQGAASYLIPTGASISTNVVGGNWYEVTNNSLTMTLPTPTARTLIGFIVTANATGATACTITSVANGGNIIGPGIGNSIQSIVLGAQDAFIILIADGSNWTVTAGQQDTGWLVPTLVNSFTDLGANNRPVGYRKQGNRVELRGVTTGGTTNTTMMTLPTGFHPTGDIWFNCILNHLLTFIQVMLVINGTSSPAGAVVPFFAPPGAPIDISLDGVNFTVD